MSVSIVSSPSNEVIFNKLRNIRFSFKEGIRHAYYDIRKYYLDTINREFLAKKTGRIYIVRLRGRRIRHQASAPYESPAKLSGNLQKSIKVTINGWSSFRFKAGTDVKVNYARYLEEGTSKMLPRPYMLKTINLNERNTIEAFYRNISKKL